MYVFLSTESLLLRKRRDTPVCLAIFHTVALRVGMRAKQNRKKTIARDGRRASQCMGGTKRKGGTMLRDRIIQESINMSRQRHRAGFRELLQITQDWSRDARVQWAHAFLGGKDWLVDTRAGQRLQATLVSVCVSTVFVLHLQRRFGLPVLLLHMLHLREEWTAFIIYSIEHYWGHLDQQARDSRLLRNERTVSSNLFLPSPRSFALFFGSIFQLQSLMAHTVHTLEPGRGVGSFKLLREDGVVEKRSLPDPAVSSVELSSGHISVMFCSFFPLWLMFPPDVGVSRQHKAGQIWVV